ncbi:MAG: hypothetical protein JF888_09450 [Candidatus Dormibacteraeota bacterium]|uniref:SCP2 domain-containing protein n=1 Tax=Candidatus Dormiibacter inghamiae TaxID=3127013 RepID=A0A934NCE4_9BACT|nr:hypothetical protein [Candidatus Dormibacteraeota bacterium]MBJ7606785.1 hypothetical protein [Candidatus Dormibacteraeota bacterium]
MAASASPRCSTLAEYLAALVAELERTDPIAYERMGRTVGKRRARIGVDDEAVDVALGVSGSLEVTAAKADAPVDGEGYTDRGTLLDLLSGYLEVTEAVTRGRLTVRGQAGDVVRIFQAIEIILDASPRAPGLQGLSDDFKFDCRREERFRVQPAAAFAGSEMVLLARLGLLGST